MSAPVNIIDDGELEGTEDFYGNLTVGADFAGVANVIFDPDRASADIIDDDGMYNVWHTHTNATLYYWSHTKKLQV